MAIKVHCIFQHYKQAAKKASQDVIFVHEKLDNDNKLCVRKAEKALKWIKSLEDILITDTWMQFTFPKTNLDLLKKMDYSKCRNAQT